MITFANVTLSYNPILDCIYDKENQKIVFITKEYDEIHLVIELVDNKVRFHPRYNVNRSVEGPNEFYISVNHPNDTYLHLK